MVLNLKHTKNYVMIRKMDGQELKMKELDGITILVVHQDPFVQIVVHYTLDKSLSSGKVNLYFSKIHYPLDTDLSGG